ncbi:RNA-binding domain-containing protein [Cylindrobasidium torrendii FP15055 ss-10]|uniref:RNA-binding domain-containing protein n=1 Tax=Cylindrobasidium torrendii FP15055 ss-10 TaxID=1314674 RepID=A0A0D7BWE3_9AGAR|nr:RNA-binding domain-containing protein [Cylindrobasidium torrendii FP15055 ss-10]
MSATSSASSSASSRKTSPVPTKRKRADDADSDSDSSDSEVEEGGEEGSDIPVLSHAEKRRQKKKQADEANPAKKAKLDPLGKRQNSVWVGNMSYKTTEDDLKSFFNGCGEVTRINLPRKPSTRPGVKGEGRGFAYVDFATPDAKLLAIGLSEQPLIGRKLLIKDGDDFKGRPAAPTVEGADDKIATAPKTHSKTAQKILRSQKQPPAPTLFLGNLGFDTTEESIQGLFDAHRFPTGKKPENLEEKDPWIRKVRMGTFEDSGACKGFAFVDFSSVEHATSALVNMRNHSLNGRSLKVEYASADAVRRGALRPKVEGAPTRTGASRPQKRERNALRKPAQPDGDAEMELEAEAEPQQTKAKKPMFHMKREGNNPKYRARPGAALAQAQRQSVAIVTDSAPSKKIKF